MSDINERIKKLKALALRGVGGEKEQAQALLEKLTKKYCISLEDLDENKIEFFVLEYHGEIEKRLIVQITYKILNKDGCVYSRRYVKSGRKCRTKLEIECTEAQKIEIEFLFDFYKKLWEKEVEIFFKAFIQNHSLFGKLKDGESGTHLTNEQLFKMYQMMQGLSNDKPLLQIESGGETN